MFVKGPWSLYHTSFALLYISSKIPLCCRTMWSQCIEETLSFLLAGTHDVTGPSSFTHTHTIHRDAAPPPPAFLLIAVVNGIAWLCSSITVKCKEKGSLVQNFMIHNWLNRGVISWLNREVCSGGSKAFSCPCKIWLRNRLMGPIQSWRCKVLGIYSQRKIRGWYKREKG